MFANLNYDDKERMEYAMEKIKVLVVDAESRMRKLVSDFLTRDGYEVIEAGDGEEAVEIFFQNKDIAVILLDVMMPKMNGWQVLKTIREYSQVPVIMLTAKGEEQDELHGFDLGVDEYISKPFSPKILVARVGAVLKRSNQVKSSKLECGGIVIDKAAHQVTIDGKEIELSFKEFELLTYFMENRGIVMTRDQILCHIWGYDFDGETRTVDVHVRTLRQKLGNTGRLIETVRGVGYRMADKGGSQG